MMTNDELNELVAEKIMGWIPLSGDEIPENITSRALSSPHLMKVWTDPEKKRSLACKECGSLPEWTSDRELVFNMESQLEKLGKRHSSRVSAHPFMLYTVYLMETVGLLAGWDNGTYRGNPHDFFKLLQATPRQRVIAALKAVGVEVDVAE